VDATHAVGDPWYNCAAEDRNVSITSAGNPDLEEETGKSLTIGVVLQPSFLPGFSLTADYYDIEVTNLIAVLGGQTILNQCVDLPDINNQYCGLIAPRDQYGLFADPALTSAGVNFAKYTARGIDFDMAYVHTFDNGFEGRLRGLATYTLERRNYTSPVNPDRYDRVLSNLGDPVFSGSITAGLDTGPIDLQYSLRYIGQQTIFAYSATHQVQDRPPENPDVAAEVWYPETFYHAARVGFEVDEDYEFYLGVDNIFDTKPPFGATGTGAGSAIFDNIGRYFYAGFHANF
jgi:outer membrane receptor protein involved in Fe transport